MTKMTAIIATALVLALAFILSGCAKTQIELGDFTVPGMVVNYEGGEWYFYKKRGVKPADYVLATVVVDSVITEDEIGLPGDYYVVEEDGRAAILSSERFKESYVKVGRLKLPPSEDDIGEIE